MPAKTAILDGDHGSDDFITTLMMLGRPDIYHLAGVLTTRGNVSAKQSAHNAALAVAMGRGSCPVYIGAEQVFAGPDLAGDDAFGHDGLGGATFPGLSPAPVHTGGVDWLIGFLNTHKDVTLYITGPLTTLALALQKDPGITASIKQVAIMGGALNKQGPQQRIGNITPYAEFNFYMDPFAADFVLAQSIPLVLYPLDLTHQLVFSPARQELFRQRVKSPLTENLITMLRAAEHYDMPKFGATGAFFHDQHVILGDLAPELYEYEMMGLQMNLDSSADDYGQMIIDPARPKHKVAMTLKDPDKAFDVALDALKF